MSSARLGVIKTVTHDKITTTANPIVSTRDIVGSLHPQLFPLSRVCKPPLEILVRRLHKLAPVVRLFSGQCVRWGFNVN